MEDHLWNDATLLPPPVNTYKAENNNFDYQTLRGIMKDAIDLLENQEIFHKEIAVVSRLIYKMGRKFRHDIGYSYLKRTKIALLKYASLNFIQSVKTFYDVIESSFRPYLPTRQMLEYVLVRFQTFSKLMCRIVSCSKKGATFYYDRIRRGDAWWLSFLPFSVLSRIWYLSRHLLKNACKWYNLIVPFKDKLKTVGVPLMPADYVFPEDLNVWLEIDQTDESEALLWKSAGINFILDSQNITSSPSIEAEDTNLSKNDTIDTTLSLKSANTYISYATNDAPISDIGETISRECFVNQSNNNKDVLMKDDSKNINISHSVVNEINKITKRDKTTHSKSKVNKNVHCLESVKSKKTLIDFLKLEETYRNSGDAKTLTQNLGFMQWQSLKNICTAISSKMNGDNEKKLLKKFKTTWNLKC